MSPCPSERREIKKFYVSVSMHFITCYRHHQGRSHIYVTCPLTIFDRLGAA